MVTALTNGLPGNLYHTAHGDGWIDNTIRLADQFILTTDVHLPAGNKRGWYDTPETLDVRMPTGALDAIILGGRLERHDQWYWSIGC